MPVVIIGFTLLPYYKKKITTSIVVLSHMWGGVYY